METTLTTLATQATQARELARLERRYWQALQDKDSQTAAGLSDEPCLVAGASGAARVDRATLAKMLDTATWTLESFELSKLEVQLVTDDVAVVVYKVHEELSVDGRPVAFDAADSSTWVRREGRWLCAAHTESLVGDPFGRDRHSTKE